MQIIAIFFSTCHNISYEKGIGFVAVYNAACEVDITIICPINRANNRIKKFFIYLRNNKDIFSP